MSLLASDSPGWVYLLGPMRKQPTVASGYIIQDEPEIIFPITCAEDILPAIEVAREYPEARWYVERRIQALGVEAEYQLPWSPDA